MFSAESPATVHVLSRLRPCSACPTLSQCVLRCRWSSNSHVRSPPEALECLLHACTVYGVCVSRSGSTRLQWRPHGAAARDRQSQPAATADSSSRRSQRASYALAGIGVAR